MAMQSHQRQQLHQHGALPPNHYAMQQHDHPMRAPSSLCREVPTTKNIKRPAAADAGLARAVDGGAPAPHGGGGAYVPGAPRTWNSAVPAGSGRGGGGAGHHEDERHRTLLRQQQLQQQRTIERPLAYGLDSNKLAGSTGSNNNNMNGRNMAPQKDLPSAASTPAPPLLPPPVLSAAQQGHLRQILREREVNGHQQIHERSAAPRRGGVVGEVHRNNYPQIRQTTAGAAGTEGGYKLPSPSHEQFQMRHHHQQQQQHTDAAAQQQHQQRLTVAAVPHYATMAIAVPSPHAVTVHGAPSPVVPVYSSFSEALREQQKQQQQARALAHQFQQQQQHAPAYHQGQSQLQQQQHDVRPTGSGGHVGHSPSMPVTSTGGALHHVPLPHARQAHDHAQQQPQQQQQQQPRQQVLHRRPLNLPDDNAQHGQLHGRPSPSQELPQQPRFFQGAATPVMGLHHQTMVSPAHKAVGGDHTAPAAPPTPLHVLSSQAASVSAPATPVMVYTYPHGYMMAYTQARTPQQPTVSQAAWNPYECVSPAGEVPTAQQGFSRVRADRPHQESPSIVSREGSPVLTGEDQTGATSACTKDSVRDLGSFSSSASMQTRSRASSTSNLSDVIDRGFDEENDPAPTLADRKPLLPEPLKLGDDQEGLTSARQVSPPETPVRTRGSSAQGEDDKENMRDSQGGVLRNGKEGSGSSSVESTPEEQLSGKKRGGDSIEKQKSFTGSYFQVSPASFLQPSKRQRGDSHDADDTSVRIQASDS